MATNSTNSMSVTAQLVVLGAMWGGAFTLIKFLVHHISPLEMAAARLALGALAVFALLIVRGRLRLPGAGLILPIAVVAALDTLIPYTLVGFAESRIDSGTAAVLISTMPLFTVVVATVVLRQETAGPARIAGMAVGFFGVLVLFGRPSADSSAGIIGQLAVIAAAACYAAAAFRARNLLQRIDPANFTAAKLALGAALAAVAMATLGEGEGLASLSPGPATALLALGAVCTGMAFVLYFRIVAAAGSVGASMVTYIIPVFALLFGAVTLGEDIRPETLAGMALIVAGVAFVIYSGRLESMARRALRGRDAGAGVRPQGGRPVTSL